MLVYQDMAEPERASLRYLRGDGELLLMTACKNHRDAFNDMV